jgi:type II secretory pathway pseudopilin PulG
MHRTRRMSDVAGSVLPGSRRGFTLIEAALVTVIVGVGVLAIVQAEQAYIQQNNVAQRMGTALLLANEIREMTMGMPQRDPISGAGNWGPEAGENSVADFDDLDDLDGAAGAGTTYAPPISALRQNFANLPGWSQAVTVENVLDGDVSSAAAAPDGSTSVMRVTCRVLYQRPGTDQPAEITRLTWLRSGTP